MPTATHDHRVDPLVRDLARYAVDFADHPDLDELHRRGVAALAADGQTSDLGELAADYHDSPENRVELVRSAREVLALPLHEMSDPGRRLLGAYVCTLGAVLVALLPWAWSLATRVLAVAPDGTVRAHFLGLAFTPTPEFAVIAIVALTAVLGSFVVMAQVFASRAGHETLERGYLWWYFTRPLISAALAVVFHMTIVAGYFDNAATEGRPALVVAAATGGVAGLFTDQVLDKMRGILGLLPYNSGAAADGTGSEGRTPT